MARRPRRSCGHAEHERALGHVPRDHGAGAHEGLLTHLDARKQHGARPDPAAAAEDRPGELLPGRAAPGGRVVREHDRGGMNTSSSTMERAVT